MFINFLTKSIWNKFFIGSLGKLFPLTLLGLERNLTIYNKYNISNIKLCNLKYQIPNYPISNIKPDKELEGEPAHVNCLNNYKRLIRLSQTLTLWLHGYWQYQKKTEESKNWLSIVYLKIGQCVKGEYDRGDKYGKHREKTDHLRRKC